MELFKFKVTKKEDGEKIDRAIVLSGLDLSRRKIRLLIDKKKIHINGKPIGVASYRVRAGDLITARFALDELKSESSAIHTVANQAPITDSYIYNKNGVIVINKLPGIPVQKPKSQSEYNIEDLVRKSSPGYLLCHRLDKETSGVLVLAKSKASVTFIMNQFKERQAKKTYLAACSGIPPQKEWEVKCHLSKIDQNTGKVRVVKNGGRPSHTEFKLVGVNQKLGISLVECTPQTGRGHQIRVHLASCGLPILGDKHYNTNPYSALPEKVQKIAGKFHLLHAQKLIIKIPSSNNPVVFEAPLPPLFAELLEFFPHISV